MARGKPKPKKAKQRPAHEVYYEVYRDLGPGRRLKDAAELLDKSESLLEDYSSKHDWKRLVTEHDHAALREALGKREIIREHGTQQLVDAIPVAVKTLMDIMADDGQLPILDRQGEHMRGPAGDDGSPGELLYKPMVKASTRANCAEKILGIAGLVPVKRMETVDRTAESLDEAAGVMRSMTPPQLEALMKILGDGE